MLRVIKFHDTHDGLPQGAYDVVRKNIGSFHDPDKETASDMLNQLIAPRRNTNKMVELIHSTSEYQVYAASYDTYQYIQFSIRHEDVDKLPSWKLRQID